MHRNLGLESAKEWHNMHLMYSQYRNTSQAFRVIVSVMRQSLDKQKDFIEDVWICGNRKEIDIKTKYMSICTVKAWR